MAESMKGLKRTHRCTEISTANIGETVTLMGFTPTHLSLAIGMLNGVFKER